MFQYNNGKTFIEPTIANTKIKATPLSDLFTIITNLSAEGKSFIDFILTPKNSECSF